LLIYCRIDSGRQRVENLITDKDDDDDEGFMVEEGAQENLLPEREPEAAPTEDDGQHGEAYCYCVIFLSRHN